jgi:putative membrane protein
MSEDNKRDNQSLTRGIVAGAIGGLVASWIMNVFMEEAGPAVQHVAQHLDGTAHQGTSDREQPSAPSDESVSEKDEPKIDATMKTADAVFSTITGGRHLSFESKQKGGPIVHYAFGAVMGALYGAAAEYAPVTRAGFGTVFASALFTGADLIAVPALNLSGSSAPAPISSLASPFSAHIVYGMATEAVRRLVRKAI